jgi:dGTPase
MFENVYIGSLAKEEEEKAMRCLEQIYNYYLKSPEKMPPEFVSKIDLWGIEVVVCDYIAGMTDRYAIYEYSNIFIPSPWGKIY